MSFTEAISSVIHQYATFTGRARRKEYWYWGIFAGAISGVLSTLTRINSDSSFAMIFSILSIVFSLAIFIPSLAVNIRRLHDIGKSGVWILLGLIPFVGWIPLLVFACMDSQPGENEYGPNPKENSPTF